MDNKRLATNYNGQTTTQQNSTTDKIQRKKYNGQTKTQQTSTTDKLQLNKLRQRQKILTVILTLSSTVTQILILIETLTLNSTLFHTN